MLTFLYIAVCTHVDIRGQLVEVSFLSPPYEGQSLALVLTTLTQRTQVTSSVKMYKYYVLYDFFPFRDVAIILKQTPLRNGTEACQHGKRQKTTGTHTGILPSTIKHTAQ